MLPNTNKISSLVEGASSFFRQLDRTVMTTLSIRLMLMSIIVLVLLGILLLHYLGIISIKIKPFSTTGAIYVDSPEIYTRERLVNDRYDQDFWLRKQLERLDDSNSLITAEIDSQISGGIAKEPSSVVTQQPMQDIKKSEKLLAIPFDQDFRIRSAVRDAIRQLILENILDDRHDLMGNSVYGLKFDTTVIPGDYTQEQAFVRVKLTVDDPFNIDINKLQIRPLRINWNEILPHQNAYYLETDPYKPDGVLHNAKYIYDNWLGSIKDRLNIYLDKKFKSYDFGLKCKNALQGTAGDVENSITEAIRETIHMVLGYADKRDLFASGKYQGETRIMLPFPWVKLMRLNFRPIIGKEACTIPPVLDVVEQSDSVYIFSDEQAHERKVKIKGTGDDEGKTIAHIKYQDNTIKGRVLAFQLKSPTASIQQLYDRVNENWDSFKPSYTPSDALIDLNCKPTQLEEGCGFYIPSGFFNFIERVQKSDFYSYAVFPKNEVAGILSTDSANLQLASQLEDKSWLNIAQGRHESQLESVLVGFGDGGNGIQKGSAQPAVKSISQEDIQFGWVISSTRNMSPTQKTELALVSVPAWATRLNLNIKTGWLDRNANEIVEKEFDIEDVPVPPDFQALDSLVLKDTKFQRKPKILNNFMESNIKVMACENAKILIPGTRLWRSTTVTLGAQKADRITVLPNMEGIIADFTPVEASQQDESNVLKAKLQVWTSEGMDTAEKEIEIQLPSKDEGCPVVARKQ